MVFQVTIVEYIGSVWILAGVIPTYYDIVVNQEQEERETVVLSGYSSSYQHPQIAHPCKD